MKNERPAELLGLRLVACLLDKGGELGVGHGAAVDEEGAEFDPAHRSLAVLWKAFGVVRAHQKGASRQADHTVTRGSPARSLVVLRICLLLYAAPAAFGAPPACRAAGGCLGVVRNFRFALLHLFSGHPQYLSLGESINVPNLQQRHFHSSALGGGRTPQNSLGDRVVDLPAEPLSYQPSLPV